jgi:hypothetical protein
VINIKKLKLILKILLIVFTLIYPLFFNLLGGIGTIYESSENFKVELIDEKHFEKMRLIGVFMLSSSFFMTMATLIYFFRKKVLSFVFETLGFSLCMYSLFKLSEVANSLAISDDNFVPYSEKYFINHFPTILHLIILLILLLLKSENKNIIKRVTI